MNYKKALSIILFCAALLLSACGSGEPAKTSDVDVDLSRLGGAVVYGKVYDMVTNGSQYEGQTVRMAGTMNEIPVTQRGVQVDTLYSCYISDAEGCCAQGIEFVLAPGTEYPPVGEKIVVEGVWNNYTLYGVGRCRLLDAKLK